MSKRIHTVTAGQESFEASLALEYDHSVVESQALQAVFSDSGDPPPMFTEGADVVTYHSPVGSLTTLDALGGNDQVNAQGGGSVDLFGGLGNDILAADGASSIIDGEDGNDTLYAFADQIQLIGGNGDDILYGYGGADGNDQLDGGDGNDTLLGGAGEDYLEGARAPIS